MINIKNKIIDIVYFIKTLKTRLKNTLNLSGNGERVDIIHNGEISTENLDMYQISHLYRYKYALEKIENNSIVGDFACGTGYGSILLSNKAKKVIGIDINKKVIKKIQQRYNKDTKVSFICSDLLKIKYNEIFDTIVSFETIEHFNKNDIEKILSLYQKALKNKGTLIFSTPYMQKKTKEAIKLGFHLTFEINEKDITSWLSKYGFKVLGFMYQNYKTHLIEENLEEKDFIICVAQKI